MLAEWTLTVMYGQIEVVAVGSAVGGLLWSEEETAQGFAWTPSLVGFGVPDHDGLCLLSIDAADRFDLSPEALWAVRVPFEVPPAGVEIGTLFDTRPVPVPPASYGLVFEALPGSGREGEDPAYRLRLTFGPAADPPYAILREGAGLSTGTVLRERADPA